MKIILSQSELEQIVAAHLNTMGIDTTDKEVDFVFLEGAEIEIGNAQNSSTKPKRQTKTKKTREAATETTTDAFDEPDMTDEASNVTEEFLDPDDNLFDSEPSSNNEENNESDDDDEDNLFE